MTEPSLKTIPAQETEQVVTFTTDELTALCPFDFGGPDFYTVILRYVPNDKGIESKSLKQYLESFRDVEATAETIAETIYTDVVEAIQPERVYLSLEQARRGGIEETVEMGNYELRR